MAEYIEREALIALLKADMDFCYKELGDSPFSKGAQTGFNAGINYATVLPAADVAERKRGRWEKVLPSKSAAKWSTKVSCSVCHRSGYTKYNFCPNCGCLMGGD